VHKSVGFPLSHQRQIGFEAGLVPIDQDAAFLCYQRTPLKDNLHTECWIVGIDNILALIHHILHAVT
jgi:hypothetical protein